MSRSDAKQVESCKYSTISCPGASSRGWVCSSRWRTHISNGTVKVKGIGSEVPVSSASPRAARWTEVTSEQYPLTCTARIIDKRKGNRVDPRGVNSCPYRTPVEAVASIRGQVIQAIVGDGEVSDNEISWIFFPSTVWN